MKKYYLALVGENPNEDNKIHADDCICLPSKSRLISLGEFKTLRTAKKAAELLMKECGYYEELAVCPFCALKE